MAYITQDSIFARYLDIIQVETSMIVFLSLPVLGENDSLESIAEITLNDLYHDTHELMDRGTILSLLKRLQNICIIANGQEKLQKGIQSRTWGIRPEYAEMLPYINRTNLLFGEINECSDTIFGQPHSKGAPPGYVIAEMLLILYKSNGITVSEFNEHFIGSENAVGFMYNGKHIAETTLLKHRNHLKRLGIIEFNDLDNNVACYSLTGNALNLGGLEPSDIRYATTIYNFVRQSGNRNYLTKADIKQGIGAELTDSQISAGLTALSSRKVLAVHRSSAWYEQISLTEKGEKIARLFYEIYSSL